MLVFLDDIRDCPSDDWTLVRNYEEALKLIQENWQKLRAISLDHDLGDSGERTGYDLTCWMEEFVQFGTNPLPGGIVVNVHSANPVGAKRMGAALDNVVKLSGLNTQISYLPHKKLMSLGWSVVGRTQIIDGKVF